ncbi:hypothetical protein DO97_12670 [Neosynechococcus sphagnicola sy1]|uniref:RING-type E3 ubiquitin transferase n=1 Tax=Neosynechococcus sphagnicola sy1 TaxID=1497020 RepID=A0A098TN51_9CYAN|nr:E3 ubiquitin ligase family protein [Neosynechococcus sphagnicola]KGF73681.1 hypothetical protein DO97_12670 [Neosynechococcus sphagnicola sy1]
MGIFGGILLVVGIVLFFVQKHHKEKLRSVRLARSAAIADLNLIAAEIAQEMGQGSWRDYVKVNGKIQCDQPLNSELKQSPCVYYSMNVTREYEETVTRQDSEGKTVRETQRGSETIASNSQSTPFYVQDKTGKILVSPDTADIETVQILNEFRQGKQSSGSLSFGNFSIDLNVSLGSGGRRTLGYRYTESILPVGRNVFVLATASDETGELTLRRPTESGRKFVISLKSEDELAKDTQRVITYSFYGMIASLVIGVVLLLLALVS